MRFPRKLSTAVAALALFTCAQDDEPELISNARPTTSATALTAMNGLALNGLGSNGLALNGLALNGLALNGLALNGLALNGLALNGLALNGLALNGLALNGLALNGLALNGLALNGLALNGLALNGLALNGLALNGLQQEAFKVTLGYLAECALGASQCITVTDFDGVTPLSYCGSAGLDPTWYSSAPNLGVTDVVAQCVIDRGTGDGHTVTHSLVNYENFKIILRYLAQCALSPSQTVHILDIDGTTTLDFTGAMGLATTWESQALSASGQRRVSACLAARTNASGKTVQLSLRGVGIEVTPLEKAQYQRHEGIFAGNLFGDTPYIKTCTVDGGGISGRVCSESDDCGFTSLGNCSDPSAACTWDAASGLYVGCGGEAEVINTFLPFDTSTDYGAFHSCAKESDGSMRCWGLNTYGEFGNGTTSSSMTFAAVPSLDFGFVTQISLGARTSCALTADGAAWCWGENISGALGVGDSVNRTSPTPLASLGYDLAQLSNNGDGGCVVRTDGHAFCWGENTAGQVGDGTTVARQTPVQVVGGGGMGHLEGVAVVDRATSGGEHTCALKNDGTLWCWGQNASGAVGDGTTTNRTTPVQANVPLSGSSTVIDFCTGSAHTCAIRSDGTVWCWGNCQVGQVGLPADYLAHPDPVQVGGLPGTAKPASIGCGDTHACVLLENQSVWCWGYAYLGQLGRGTWTVVEPIAAPMLGINDAIGVFAGGNNTCVLRSDGSTWCTGKNSSGELGVGSNVPNYVLAPVKRTITQCGNGACSSGEDCSTCSADCGVCQVCGDGTCSGTESCSTCVSDCGVCQVCGDGTCSGAESCSTCVSDCGCTSPQTCGGGGSAGVCGCTATTCAAQGVLCGTIANGCGGTLNCGACLSETESNNTTTLANSISTSGSAYVGYLSSSTDVDYFKLILGAGKTVMVDMIVPAGKNYNVTLYNGTKVLVSGTQGAGLAEHVTYKNTSTKSITVHIKVFGVSGAYSATASYTLKAAW